MGYNTHNRVKPTFTGLWLSWGLTTKNDPTANIGNLKLNSLIFQDDIARMNSTMDQARQGAQDIGRLLESKQLRANIGKSKAVIMGSEDAREEMLRTIT